MDGNKIIKEQNLPKLPQLINHINEKLYENNATIQCIKNLVENLSGHFTEAGKDVVDEQVDMDKNHLKSLFDNYNIITSQQEQLNIIYQRLTEII